MNLKQTLEAQEQEQNMAVWAERLTSAKSARSAWDTDYAKAAAILSNKVATGGGKNDLSQFTDKMFHTNWLLKLCNWLSSYIMSADVYGDLQSHTGSDDTYPDRLILEMELNRVLSRFEMVRGWCVDVVPNRIKYGYGVSYTGWNSKARDHYWRNGKPNFITLDPRRVWVDESAGGLNFKDRQWVFAKMTMPTDEAKAMFPEHKIADSTGNTTESDPANRKGKFDYYLVQYRKTKTMRMIDVQTVVDGKVEIEQVPYEQVQEYVANNPNAELPDNMQIEEEADEQGMGYEAEFPAVFQFMYSFELNAMLTPPEYIGDIDQFQFWCYHPIDDDIYPRGTAFMLSDEQTIKSILLTTAVIEAIKNGRKIPIPMPGALLDEEDFILNHNNLDYVPQLNPEWTDSHPGQEPIIYIDQEFNPTVTAFLNNLLKDEMQQFTGGTDSMMGQAQYSGMSAAQTGLLQSSGATYTKSDELSYRDYVKDVMDNYLRQICTFMTYEHTIDGVNAETGGSQTMTINRGGQADWDWQRYLVEPIIENSPEAIKQLKKSEAMQLAGMGAITPVRMLDELGYNNAEQLVREADERNGLLAIIEKLRANPELMQMLQSAPDKPNKASNA